MDDGDETNLFHDPRRIIELHKAARRMFRAEDGWDVRICIDFVHNSGKSFPGLDFFLGARLAATHSTRNLHLVPLKIYPIKA